MEAVFERTQLDWNMLMRQCDRKVFVFGRHHCHDETLIEKIGREKNVNYIPIFDSGEHLRQDNAVIVVTTDAWGKFQWTQNKNWMVLSVSAFLKIAESTHINWNRSRVIKSLNYSNLTFVVLNGDKVEKEQIAEHLKQHNATIFEQPNANVDYHIITSTRSQSLEKTKQLLQIKANQECQLLGKDFNNMLKMCKDRPARPNLFLAKPLEGVAFFLILKSLEYLNDNLVKLGATVTTDCPQDGCIVPMNENEKCMVRKLLLCDVTKHLYTTKTDWINSTIMSQTFVAPPIFSNNEAEFCQIPHISAYPKLKEFRFYVDPDGTSGPADYSEMTENVQIKLFLKGENASITNSYMSCHLVIGGTHIFRQYRSRPKVNLACIDLISRTGKTHSCDWSHQPIYVSRNHKHPLTNQKFRVELDELKKNMIIKTIHLLGGSIANHTEEDYLIITELEYLKNMPERLFSKKPNTVLFPSYVISSAANESVQVSDHAVNFESFENSQSDEDMVDANSNFAHTLSQNDLPSQVSQCTMDESLESSQSTTDKLQLDTIQWIETSKISNVSTVYEIVNVLVNIFLSEGLYPGEVDYRASSVFASDFEMRSDPQRLSHCGSGIVFKPRTNMYGITPPHIIVGEYWPSQQSPKDWIRLVSEKISKQVKKMGVQVTPGGTNSAVYTYHLSTNGQPCKMIFVTHHSLDGKWTVTFTVERNVMDIKQPGIQYAAAASPAVIILCGQVCACKDKRAIAEMLEYGGTPRITSSFLHKKKEILDTGTPLVMLRGENGWTFMVRQNANMKGIIKNITHSEVKKLLQYSDGLLESGHFTTSEEMETD